MCVGGPIRQAGASCKDVVFGRVAELVAHVRAEQMHDDEAARVAVFEDALERLQHDAVETVGVLRAAVIEVDLLVHLLGETGEHGVALRQGLLIGDPVRAVAGLLHDRHQRRTGKVKIGVFLIGEGQHLLQGFDGVGTGRIDVIEHGQLVAHRRQLGRGVAPVAVEAHVQAAGRFADDQHQRARFAGVGVAQAGDGWNVAATLDHGLHFGQLALIVRVGDEELPRNDGLQARDHGFLHLFDRKALAHDLGGRRNEKHADDQRKDDSASERLHAQWADAAPEPVGASAIDEGGGNHPPTEILTEVFGRFRRVGFEGDEEHALRKLLTVDCKVTQTDQRT